MTIRAVAFDIGSVITQVDPDYFAAIEADFGLTRAEWGPLLHGPEAAEHNMPAVPWHTEDVVTYFTSVLKPRCGSKAAAAAERLAGVYVSLDALSPVEGMVELLLGLRRAGRPVGLLSNGPVESGSELMPVLLGAALPDVIVLSGSHGVTKPDREAFEMVAGELRVKLEECFFVDDQELHVEAARALGMTAHRFQGDPAALEAELRAAGMSW
ncbi:MAG: HAD-IA family hydrolase [Chloroflexi bacterium]|nr:HAD-IA family hydrolase [Chloroflexota bacterium]